MTMTQSKNNQTKWHWLLGALLLAPIQLGAKGCEVGVVGVDGTGGVTSGGATSTGGASTGGKTSTVTGKICGGLMGASCAKSQYCYYEPEAQCGAADQTGVCRVLPNACTDIYQPVCGCDDKTYGNACDAATHGVSVLHEGACEDEPTTGTTCGGLMGAGCGTFEYCKYPIDAMCGAADQTGTCTLAPDACTEIYKPVCGCDDVTYSNECFAAAQGVSVAKEGECATTTQPGETCGGLLGLSCAKGEFCNYAIDAMCGAADQTGKCTPIPEACDLMYSPVCGCDDKTYGNECAAAAAGVSVASTGECKTEPSTGTACGSRGLPACGAGQFCSYEVTAQCGATDIPGTCTPRPEACITLYSPVCGCDGKTYGNSCEAAGAGVSVKATGACESTTTTNCGGIAGLQCKTGQYCNFAPDAMCGAADQMGTCATIPSGCTKENVPVCGCDGKTYGNACMAAAAGISVAKTGGC